MGRIEKTVFISYRRTDVYTALAVYENLKNQGYDVFFDYTSIPSGDFEQIITSNIKARAHFLIILTPTALDRCNEPGDWLRREIEIAIEEKRNIVPLLFKGFRFGTPNISEILTGKLKNLSRYNGLNVHEDYFGEAMHRLRTQFLNKPLDTVLHPVSTEVQRAVEKEQVAADEALRNDEAFKQPFRQVSVKPLPRNKLPKPFIEQIRKYEAEQIQLKKKTRRLVSYVLGALVFLALCIWGGISLWSNLSSATPEPTRTSLPVVAATSRPAVTSTPSPTRTMIPPTPTLGIGSTMTGKDGMTLLYVPAGEFTMGSESGDDDEKPVHTVYLDAFWINQTEVTNVMYTKCVDAGVCTLPFSTKSYSRDSYYGNPEFDNYPVIYVDWNMARTYCEWVGHRLPTEAEWEKAARGTDGRIYPWGDGAPNNNLLNYNSAVGDTTEVGKYPNGVSMYGAHDMAGNVWEWVKDWYDAYPGNTVSNSDYGTEYRVLRGGSWSSSFSSVRSASRIKLLPMDTLSGYVGFRCASSP